MNTIKNPNTDDIFAERTSEVSEELLRLLNSTVLGTPGKLRYKQTTVEQTLRSLRNLEFIQIKKRKRVLGTAGFIHRETRSNNRLLKTLYVRYLSVYNPFRNVKQKKKSKSRESKKNHLRDSISSIFNQELNASFDSNNQSGLYYAFVEKENIQSKRLCESFGFKATRKVCTYLFSRFFPKKSPDIRILGENELGEFRTKLEDFYANYSLMFNDLEPSRGKLYGIYKDGNMITGLRAFPVKWRLIDVPGFSGFLMQKVLPKIPVFNRIFSREYFQFLVFDHVWHSNGNQDSVQKLMEHACADFSINVGLCWQDDKSSLSHYLSKRAKLGFLNTVNEVVEADLMVRWINDENKEVLEYPIFISAVDMT